MKLLHLLSFSFIFVTISAFGMEKCPNRSFLPDPEMPRPMNAALQPAPFHNNNRAELRLELLPTLHRLNGQYSIALRHRALLPDTFFTELTHIISAIPQDNLHMRRAFSRLKQAAVKFNQDMGNHDNQ